MAKGIETINGKASGEHIRKIYNHEHDHPTRLLDKLTDLHFNYDCFDKMRVYLAVQMLSESCASAIERMISVNFFKSDKGPTASMIFCRKMNILFDLLNAKDKNDPNPNKRGISKSNIDLLKDLSIYIASFKQSGGNKVFWIDGLQQSVKCVIGLYEESFQHRNVSLLTRHLNQDPLENLFGQIRAQTVNSQNPYLLDFLRILSRILTTKLSMHAKNTNCEWDPSCDIKLIDVNNIKNQDVDKKVIDQKDIWVDCQEEKTTIKFIKNAALNISINKIVTGFKKNHQCENCEVTKLKSVAENIGVITYQLMKSNPCMTNVTQEIISKFEEHCVELLKGSCVAHQKQFMSYVANKCIVSSVKTIRNTLKRKLKNKGKPKDVHYKLRILKDK